MLHLIVRRWLKWAAALLLVAAAVALTVGSGASNGTETYDVVIANGRVMDPESGLDAIRNVGIRSGKIAAISSGPLEGKQTIEAKGLIVAPGFIDLHQHGQDAENYAAKAADGVTTALELEVGVADVDQWYSEREGKARINFGASAVHIRAPLTQVAGNFSGFEEVLAAAAITGAPLHIVHIQSTGGPNVTQELQMIADARSHGMDVTTESYPYTMGMTSIQAAMFDHKEEEPATFYSSLLWPATGEHLTKESFLRYRKQGGMVIVPANTPENVHAATVSPLTMIASDGHLAKGQGHPRTAGTYALVLGRYVREEKALDLMTALRKMTLMPAQRLEKRAPIFKDKGRIRVGADADITVFDANRILDKATYEKPLQYSEGIQFVFVNGVAVVKDGQLVDGIFPGRAAPAPLSQ